MKLSACHRRWPFEIGHIAHRGFQRQPLDCWIIGNILKRKEKPLETFAPKCLFNVAERLGAGAEDVQDFAFQRLLRGCLFAEPDCVAFPEQNDQQMHHLLGNHRENLARLLGGGALHGIVARQVLEAALCPFGESEAVNEANQELVGVDQGANRLEMS